jgi:hypothetical protein
MSAILFSVITIQSRIYGRKDRGEVAFGRADIIIEKRVDLPGGTEPFNGKSNTRRISQRHTDVHLEKGSDAAGNPGGRQSRVGPDGEGIENRDYCKRKKRALEITE